MNENHPNAPAKIYNVPASALLMKMLADGFTPAAVQAVANSAMFKICDVVDKPNN